MDVLQLPCRLLPLLSSLLRYLWSETGPSKSIEQETGAPLDLEHGLNGRGVQSVLEPTSSMGGSKLSLDEKEGLNEYEGEGGFLCVENARTKC
ncbi:hypothetical protein F5878DRAFT_632419 [Lentinula raphanica]|uniref:Uncharacterized protein n=1 Tax=Lentinula raphanica TaxID=153919 RepID=A0AA38NZQ9_9AGAR|nr:hypothetical protein F5878DRAFT_632419 [Lentinula raphanica]